MANDSFHAYQSIVQVFSGITIGCAVGWFAHVLVIRREAKGRVRSAKDAFHTVVAQQRAKLETTLKFKEEEFFTESLPVLAEAVYKMEHILPLVQWATLRQLWMQYSGQDHGQYGSGLARVRANFETGKSHSQRLRKWLDDFDECVPK